MYPMLEIKTVPIEIQVKVKDASLEYTRGTAEMEISRSDSGGVDIKSRPIRLQLDTFETRGGKPMPSVSQHQAAKQPTYEATATFAQQGQQLMLNAKLGDSAQLSDAAGAATVATAAAQSAAATANTEWQDGSMEIRYEMDKLNFDWKIDMGEFKFTPGDIEISVAQRPDITIKYVGGPIYVPKSSDPNYQPVDVQA